MRHFLMRLACVCSLAAIVVGIGQAQQISSDEFAASVVRDGRLPGGVCVVVGCTSVDLPLSIASQGQFVVQALFDDEEQVHAAREAISSQGASGRVSAAMIHAERLPYADNLVNLLIFDQVDNAWERQQLLAEAYRVLAPRGMAYCRKSEGAPSQTELAASVGFEASSSAGGLRLTKPWPEEIDEWSHHLHGADGNPVARDRVVGPPKHYQWLGGPRWAQSHESDSNFRCLVTARGRLYYIVNEAPTSLAGPESPPDKWFLTGRDAFNGVVLWKVPIRQWGWREWKPSWFTPRPGVIPINLDKRVVAVGDHVFATLGYRAPVSKLDGRTGEILQTFDNTSRTSEILHHDGQLLVTVNQGDRAVVKRIDTASGALVWVSENDYGGTITDYYRFTAMRGSVPEAEVDPTLDIATDGVVVGMLDGKSVVCLDFATGKEKWRTEFPLDEADHNAGRIRARDKVWTGTMIVREGVLVHASPNRLAAFSAETGEVLWQQAKKYLQHLWYEWKDVFVIDGLVWTWSSELSREPFEGLRGSSTFPISVNGYELHTGELVREIPLGKIFKTHHHHRCYRNKATERYILASRRGTEFVDLEGGPHSVNNWVRGTCHMGMMPANGLQYAPPHPCQCYVDEKLNGMNALAPASSAEDSEVESRPRIAKGPAYDETAPRIAQFPTDADWPTFRADAGRSGSVQTRLPVASGLRWQTQLGGRLGPPIGVAELVFVPLVDGHQIAACDATDGRVRWRFHAGARIDSPPTYDRGSLLFGSADGCVYRVRAADGVLQWRFRAVPRQRQIAAFGQLESAWPVHGSVLVDDSVVYFAAGRSSHLDGGVRMFALDALTGEVLQQETHLDPEYTDENLVQNYQLPMGVLPDIIRKEDDSLFMRSVRFDKQLQRQEGAPTLKIRGGFLDDAYFKRMPWTMGSSGHARLIVHDDRHAYCLRMFDSLAGLDPKVYFTPGKEGYLLYAHDLKSGKNVWAQRIPIRGRAMVATADQVCVAGPPDVIDPNDPLAAFEGRKGGVLRMVHCGDGATVSEHALSQPPVFNGAAAANGRLFLALEDGSLVCFGATQE
jgi:outer membrane protein assembly factor BamB/ubiquinone/menaquinone biosynthesis C-methylase UbiE